MLGRHDDIRIDIVAKFPHPSRQSHRRSGVPYFLGLRLFCVSHSLRRFLLFLRDFRSAQRNPACQRRLDGFVGGGEINRPAGVALFVMEIIGHHELILANARLVLWRSALIQHQPAGLHDIGEVSPVRCHRIDISGARRHREPKPRRNPLPLQRLRRQLDGPHGTAISPADPHRVHPPGRELLHDLPISYIYRRLDRG